MYLPGLGAMAVWIFFNNANVIKKLALKVVTFCEILGRICHICGLSRAMLVFFTSMSVLIWLFKCHGLAYASVV